MINFKKNKGFSLLEVIAAIFIILIGISGSLALITKVVSSANASTQRIIASGLAQEGIEIVRSIRDLNYDPADGGWDNWYLDPPLGDFEAQYDDEDLRAWDARIIRYDTTTGLYGYDVGNPSASSFTRKITISQPVDDGDEIRVVITVSWLERGASKSLIIESRLWKWR